VSRLERAGIDGARGGVVTSSMAAASLLEAGDRALVLGGPGVWEAVERVGAKPVAPAGRGSGPVDVVVIGYHTDFDYDRLAAGQRAVLGGARLVATNSDPTYPTPDGLLPGTGSLLAALETASRTKAEVAGKPNPRAAALVHQLVGSSDGDPANHTRHIMVGDVPATDGLLARRLGYRFGLVLSGVTSKADLPTEPAPDHVAADLATLVDQLAGSSP